MLTALKIFDSTTVSIGKQTPSSITIHVSGETISVRELIRLRIQQEVEAYNRSQPAVFNMLVQPSDAERTLNGYKLRTPRQIDAQAQCQRAYEAFEGNGFIVLVDDRQAASLDDLIALSPETRVNFLKLVPLVGG